MTKREAERYMRLSFTLGELGLHQPEIDTLLRCSKALHTWSEHECNGDIERDETTGKTYRAYEIMTHQPLTITGDTRDFGLVKRWERKRTRIPDRETGALTRIAAILAPHAPKQYTAETCPGRPCGADCDHTSPGLTFYHQGDPRGCCLYLIRPGDVPAGSTVDSCYSNGIAVCID